MGCLNNVLKALFKKNKIKAHTYNLQIHIIIQSGRRKTCTERKKERVYERNMKM